MIPRDAVIRVAGPPQPNRFNRSNPVSALKHKNAAGEVSAFPTAEWLADFDPYPESFDSRLCEARPL